MAASDSLSHTAAGTFTARVHAAGLDTVRAAENLGAGYFSTQEAFEGWKKSSGHAANLVMPQATRMGIALAKNPQTRYGAWWTIVLGAAFLALALWVSWGYDRGVGRKADDEAAAAEVEAEAAAEAEQLGGATT